MKKSLKQLIQTLLICLIVPSTLLLQKINPYIDYAFSYRSIFTLLLTVIVPVFIFWALKELSGILQKNDPSRFEFSKFNNTISHKKTANSENCWRFLLLILF